MVPEIASMGVCGGKNREPACTNDDFMKLQMPNEGNLTISGQCSAYFVPMSY